MKTGHSIDYLNRIIEALKANKSNVKSAYKSFDYFWKDFEYGLHDFQNGLSEAIQGDYRNKLMDEWNR